MEVPAYVRKLIVAAFVVASIATAALLFAGVVMDPTLAGGAQ